MLGPLSVTRQLIRLISLTDSKTLHYCGTLKLKYSPSKGKKKYASSTTAIITATEYTNGIFLQIHMFRFFMDLCIHWNACHEYYYFASLGIFMHQDAEVNKVTAYFFVWTRDY